MNSIKNFFLHLSLMLFSKEIYGQIMLSVTLEKFQAKTSFSIDQVKLNPTINEGLGKINIGGQRLFSVKIKGIPSQTFQQSLEKVSKNKKESIIYDIQLLDIKENPVENRRIAGTMRLKVGFRKHHLGEDTLLCETSTSSSYIRSESANPSTYFETVLGKLVMNTLAYFDAWMLKNASKHESFLKETRIDFLEDRTINNDDTLSYGIRRITWDDFKGKASNPLFGAAIFTNFAYTSKFYIENSILIAQIQTHTYMVRGMSWAKAQAKDDYGLAHEQLHFDITKLVVEKFKQKIKELAQEEKSMDDLNSRIQYEYLESYREMNALQKQYDSETGHSINRQAQTYWLEKVKKQLENF